MRKKIYNNYDDTLFGQYFRQLENPDIVRLMNYVHVFKN